MVVPLDRLPQPMGHTHGPAPGLASLACGPKCPALPCPARGSGARLATHLLGLVERDGDGDSGDEDDADGVVVVGLAEPQGDAEGLEEVERVQDLQGAGGEQRTAEAWPACCQTPSAHFC